MLNKERSLTIFTIPKSFEGDTATQQENAIKSWLELKPKPEILLLGDDSGVARIAKKYRLRHIPQIARNKNGTPLIDDLFAKAQKEASYDLMCYVNADIILLSNFIPKITQLSFPQMLVIGQRCDIDFKTPIRLTNKQWRKQLYTYAKKSGTWNTLGMDYFIFKKGFYKKIPPFAIGRGSWDTWLVKDALARNAVLIDATPSILALHQNHDYSHAVDPDVWRSLEGKRNTKLAKFEDGHLPCFYDARLILTKKGELKPAWKSPPHLGQLIYSMTARNKFFVPLRMLLKLVRKTLNVPYHARKKL